MKSIFIGGTGAMGEGIARKHLEKKGYNVVCMNYRQPWGEIDIIAERGGSLLFAEVKTVAALESEWIDASESRRPEERVTPKKLARLRRAVQSYLTEVGWGEGRWMFVVAAVYLDTVQKKAKVTLLHEPL